jgi:probable rRNA maturation factor
MAAGLAPWLTRVAPSRVGGVVGVALVGDRRVRQLNRKYRGIDRATDVLSFPAGPSVCGCRRARTSEVRARGDWATRALKKNTPYAPNPQSLIPNPQSLVPNPYFGDIVIARGVARRQARLAGHSEATELRVLALHGLLHLLGYDHERDGGTMARVERRLRLKGGLREGLIER